MLTCSNCRRGFAQHSILRFGSVTSCEEIAQISGWLQQGLDGEDGCLRVAGGLPHHHQRHLRASTELKQF